MEARPLRPPSSLTVTGFGLSLSMDPPPTDGD